MVVATLGAVTAASAEEIVDHIVGIGHLLLINVGDPGFAKELAYRSLG